MSILEPLRSAKSPRNTYREAMADFLPDLIPKRINGEVVATDVIGDVFVKAGFETSNAVEGIVLVLDLT